jgi:hypothetical protein
MSRVVLIKKFEVTIKPEVEVLAPLGELKVFVGDKFCKYIYGDVKKGAWMCCARPVTHGKSSWCDGHRAIVFEKPKPYKPSYEPRKTS